MKNLSKRVLSALLCLFLAASVIPVIAPTTVEAADVAYSAGKYLVIPAEQFGNTSASPYITPVDGTNTYNSTVTKAADDDGIVSLTVAANATGMVCQTFSLEDWLTTTYGTVAASGFAYLTVVYRVADHVHAPTELTIVADGTTGGTQPQTVTVDNSNRMYNSAMINVSEWTGNVSSVSISFDAWQAGDAIIIDSLVLTSTADVGRNRSYNQERLRNGGFVISGQDVVDSINASNAEGTYTSNNMSVEYDPTYRAAKLTVMGDGADPKVYLDLAAYNLKTGEQQVSSTVYNRVAFVYYMPDVPETNTSNSTEMRVWFQTADADGVTGTMGGTTNPHNYRNVFNASTRGQFVIETINLTKLGGTANGGSNDISAKRAYHSRIRYDFIEDSEKMASVGDTIYIAAIIYYNHDSGDGKTLVQNRVTDRAVPSSDEYRYGIKYNANGGIGAPATQVETTSTASHPMTLSSNVPTRHGYNFLGWATDTNAVTPDYTAGEAITVSGTVNNTTGQTLYAVWEASNDVYRITYDLQGGTFEDEGAVQYTYPRPSLEFTMNTVPTRPGYDFTGWKVTAVSDGAVSWNVDDVVAAGVTLSNPAGDVSLQAQWMPSGTPIRYYLSSIYGTLSSSIEYVGVNGDGSTSIPVGCYPTNITNGYVFEGWYTDPACQNPVPDAWVTGGDGKIVPVLNVKTDGGAGVDTVQSYAFYAKVTPKMLSFRLTATCVDDENQTFLYRITGTPKLRTEFGDSVSVTVAVLAGETKTVTLPVGDYVITEYVDWSWRYNDDAEQGETEALEKMVAIVSEYEAVYARAFDYNTKKQEHWLNAYASSIEAEARRDDETTE